MLFVAHAALWSADDTYPVAGDLFEAETDCVQEHTLGQVASDSAPNLSFFARKPAISAPLQQNPIPAGAPYNASKTYIAFLVGYVHKQH